LIKGILKGFGWRGVHGKGTEQFGMKLDFFIIVELLFYQILIMNVCSAKSGTYTPEKIKTEEYYRNWKALLLQMPVVESIIFRQF
jgi:hypothetical protein